MGMLRTRRHNDERNLRRSPAVIHVRKSLIDSLPRTQGPFVLPSSSTSIEHLNICTLLSRLHQLGLRFAGELQNHVRVVSPSHNSILQTVGQFFRAQEVCKEEVLVTGRFDVNRFLIAA